MGWKELKIYGKEFLFGPSHKDGVVSQCGTFQHFEISHVAYALSARTLLESEDLARLAMPIAYLQRHSLELALKVLIATAHNTNAAWEQIKDLDGGYSPKETPFGHELPKIIGHAKDALKAVGESLPDGFEALSNEFHAFEKGSPDRMRYVFIRRNGKTEASFPGSVSVDLKGRQERLEALLEEHMALTIRDGNTDESTMNLWSRMVDEEHLAGNELGYRLYDAGLLD